MFASLGKKVLKFLIVYFILSNILLVEFLAYSIPPPDILYTLPIDSQSLLELSEKLRTRGALDVLVIGWHVGLTFFNFFVGVVAGIPILLYKIASYTNNLGIVFGSTLLGIILQLSVYVYAYHYLLKWGRGEGE